MGATTDFSDGGALQDWLGGRGREDSVCVACRAALRAALGNWQRELAYHPPSARSPLLTIWPMLALSVARTDTSPEIIAATHRAGARAEETDATIGAAAVAAYIQPSADLPDRNFAHAAARAAEYSAGYSGGASAWKSVSLDCLALEAGLDPFLLPLWHDFPAELFLERWVAVRLKWESAGGPAWAFWVRWYENAIEGRPQDWALLRDIALIPAEDWQSGPDRVHPIIERMLLDRAVAVTPNGETVEVSAETGKLRLVPASGLSEDIADYARRKIRKAVALLDAERSNQYAALAPDLAMLTETVDEASNLPVELFDACASASRRLDARIRNGECPSAETDPLIADYRTRIREAGADIWGNDVKTQEMLAARNAITGNDALIEQAQALRGAVTTVLPLAEGVLTIVLSRDLEIATDPKADPEDRKAAGIKLSSRLLRISKIAAAGFARVATIIVRTKEVLEAIPAIQASQFFQQALQAILRYIIP